MKHSKKQRKFGRTKNQRNALMGSLARSLILKEKIVTTEAKAKSLRPFVEKLVTSGKDNSLSSVRLVASRVGPEAGKKLIDILGPKYKDRNGGYLRITKLETKRGDAGSEAQIEFV